jgi:hypothetical protein
MKDQAKDAILQVTAPGRMDRLVQLFYRQLPYHPQRIETGTTWTITLIRPITVSTSELSHLPQDTALAHSASQPSHPDSVSQTAPPSDDVSAWQLRAYLERTLSSASEKQGDTFRAIVAEPVFGRDHSLVVPQGSVLIGTITRVKPAKSFGRSGKLRFAFRELELPGGGSSQNIQGSLAGADTGTSQQLQIDSEGAVQSKAQDRVIVPMVLIFLAGRALDDDGSQAANAAIASNGFGIIGRVVGIVAGSRGLSAGIGFYAAGLSIYERWLARGQDVVFPKNTRVEVTTVPSTVPLPVTGLSPKSPR